MNNLNTKVAVVTGGSRGIGRAIALRLAQDGAAVIVNYAQRADAAEEVVAAIRTNGGKAHAIQADLSQIADVRRLFDETQTQFGRLDILINNAGTAKFAPLTEITEADFDTLFALNVKGVLFGLQEAAKRMADGGRIINISSGITLSGGPGGAVYAGTKGAIEQFTQVAAKELGPRGITVNTVSPGMVETDLMYAVIPAERQLGAAKASPLGRLGQPNDIADVVAFLCSEDSRWLTGLNIRANGGVS